MLILLAQAPDPPPADTAPVGLSPTTALITGIALIIGVLITTAVQVYIAHRNWTEQQKQAASDREDQRRRDAEQREDQRGRDRELWAREDRHRFTTEKRQAYVEFLASANVTYNVIVDCYNAKGVASRNVVQIERIGEVVNDLGTRMSAVRMIAPDAVGVAVFGLFDNINAAYCDMSNAGDTAALRPSILDELFEAGVSVRELMRTDLGVRTAEATD